MKANAMNRVPAPSGEPAHAASRHGSACHLSTLLLATLLTWTAQASAADVEVHGFGTLGMAYLDKPDDWQYSRSLKQRHSADDFRADLDSVIGLQVNYQASPNLELVGQAALSLLDFDSRPSDYIELAFLAWRGDPDWEVRLGRVSLDAYLISDHRDVGFTYPFVRPPVEFYSHIPPLLDGADVTRSWNSRGVRWQTKLFVGGSSGGTGASRLRTWPLAGVMASRESNGLLVRISALRGRTRNNIHSLDPLLSGLDQMQAVPMAQVAADAAQMEAALTTRGMITNYVAAAVAYDQHDWLLTAEINRSHSEGNRAISFTSGYVSIGRRFGPLTLSLTQSAQKRSGNAFTTPDWTSPLAPLGTAFAAEAQQLANGAAATINSLAGHQYTTSTALRWDMASRMALKVQWDRVDTRQNGSALWSHADGRKATSNIITLALDFVF